MGGDGDWGHGGGVMGDHGHPLGATLGRFLFYRQRGGEYAQLAKGWITPVAAVTAAGKYLGLEAGMAAVVGAAVPVVIEGAGWLAGWVDVRLGGARRQTSMANAQDPWKEEVLEILREGKARWVEESVNGYEARARACAHDA